MKKLIVLLIVLAGFSSFLFGCTEGDDGESFISLNNLTTPYAYWDDNPGVPYYFSYGTDYQSSAGTYDFWYDTYYYDYITYEGTYTITIDEGETGVLPLVPGSDGDDRYFELWLYTSGPSLYEYGSATAEYDNEVSNASSLGILDSDDSSVNKSEQSEGYTGISPDDPDVIVKELRQGSYVLTLKYIQVSPGIYD